MFSVIHQKTFQTTVLAALLFYVLGNPDTYKKVSKLPGMKFVVSSTKGITHSGVAAHAVVFAIVLYFCVWLINKTLVSHLPGINIVEGFTNHS